MTIQAVARDRLALLAPRCLALTCHSQFPCLQTLGIQSLNQPLHLLVLLLD